MKKQVTAVRTDDKDPQIYEIGYHLLSTVSQEELGNKVAQVRDIIEGKGGMILSEEFPKEIQLAYPMFKVIANKKTKFTLAYFGWIKFQVKPSQIHAIEELLKVAPEILRYIVIRTVSENTITPKKIVLIKKLDEDKEDKEDLVDDVLVSEELDRTIDDLVIG